MHSCLQTKEYKRSVGFVGVTGKALVEGEAMSAVPVQAGDVPLVRWLSIPVATSTSKAASPGEIYDSYNGWQDWSAAVQQVLVSFPFVSFPV